MTHQPPPTPSLRGSWLLGARAAWLLLAGLALGMFALSLPLADVQLQQLCGQPPCLDGRRLTAASLRLLDDLGITAQTWARGVLAIQVGFALLWCAVGTLIFWRRSDEPMALFVSLLLFLFGITFGDVLAAFTARHPAWTPAVELLSFLNWIALLPFFAMFPDGRFIPRWGRLPVLVWCAVYAGSLYAPGSLLDRRTWPAWFVAAWLIGGLGSGVLAQIYRYRTVSTALQRQQTKWVVYGASLAVLGYFAAVLPYLLMPAPFATGTSYDLFIDIPLYLAWSLLPLSFGVAVLRARLWDVDRLINRTLVYAALTAALALLYGASVVLLQLVFLALTGQESDLAVIASTLAIASLFQPMRHAVQDRIDRRFYRRKYDAERMVAAFSARVQSEVDIGRQAADLVAVVQEALEPAEVGLWLRNPGAGRREGPALPEPPLPLRR